MFSVLTAEEKLRMKTEGKEILKDRELLQTVADRTGVYIHYEVS